MATKTPDQIKSDVVAVKTITVPDALLANTDSIVREQINDLKSILSNTMDRLKELEGKITTNESNINSLDLRVSALEGVDGG